MSWVKESAQKNVKAKKIVFSPKPDRQTGICNYGVAYLLIKIAQIK